MSKTTREEIVFETSLIDGIRESNAEGKIYDEGEDKPFVITLHKVTNRKVYDERGHNWRDSSSSSEFLAALTPQQAADLARCILSNLSYITEVLTERRVLIPDDTDENPETDEGLLSERATRKARGDIGWEG
jgi:hypothetical protein